jgi:hypothetical protein
LIFFTALKLLGFLKVQLAWCPLIKAKRPQKKKTPQPPPKTPQKKKKKKKPIYISFLVAKEKSDEFLTF